MGEHMRTDRQAVLDNSDNPQDIREDSVSDRVGGLPQVSDGISIGGTWWPVHRPLATEHGATPLRGGEGHGSDNHDPEWGPDQSGEVPPLRDDPGNDKTPDFAAYTEPFIGQDPKLPLYVSQIPDPLRVVVRRTQFSIPIDPARTVYSTTTLYVPDTGATDGIVQSFSRDESRAKVTFQLSPSAAAATTLKYHYAVSHTPNFTEYILLSGTATVACAPVVLDNATEPFYITIVPIAVSDANSNTWTLNVITEFAGIANANPAGN